MSILGRAISEAPVGRGNWMQTLTGGRFYPGDPQPHEIDIRDIAGALARLCRFGGHCLRFYSVAEHCVHVASRARPSLALSALMHDASEAYLVDIPRPLKPLLSGYVQTEDRLMEVIASRFGFEWPLHPEVKQLDNAILTDERDQNMAFMDVSAELWGNGFPALGVTLEFWSTETAEREFLAAFTRYGGQQ